MTTRRRSGSKRRILSLIRRPIKCLMHQANNRSLETGPSTGCNCLVPSRMSRKPRPRPNNLLVFHRQGRQRYQAWATLRTQVAKVLVMALPTKTDHSPSLLPEPRDHATPRTRPRALLRQSGNVKIGAAAKAAHSTKRVKRAWVDHPMPCSWRPGQWFGTVAHLQR